MPGHQGGLQRFAERVMPPAHHADRFDDGQVEATEQPEQRILPLGELGRDLLDRQHAAGELHEPHHVPADAPRQGGQVFGRPGLERQRPRQIEQHRVRIGGRDLQGFPHRASVPHGRAATRTASGTAVALEDHVPAGESHVTAGGQAGPLSRLEGGPLAVPPVQDCGGQPRGAPSTQTAGSGSTPAATAPAATAPTNTASPDNPSASGSSGYQ